MFVYLIYTDYSKIIQRNQIKEAIKSGAKYMTVSCPKSLAHFNCYLNEYKVLKDRIKTIGLTIFIGELFFLN